MASSVSVEASNERKIVQIRLKRNTQLREHTNMYYIGKSDSRLFTK